MSNTTADPRLDAKAVGQVLRDMGMRSDYGCYGFNLPCLRGEQRVRIERGSGIAGRGGHWHIVRYYGKDLGVEPWSEATPSVSTRRELRRLLREWATGEQKPVERPGYVHYAKLNRNRNTEDYVWVTRRE